jgi:hypothetical protein
VAKLGGGVLVRGLGVRGARGFGRTRVSRGAKAGMPTVQSHLRVYVFDGGLGGLTCERRRGTAPVGSWGGAELECMVEIDWRCAWGWRTGSCPERHGRHGLGVDRWQWCTGGVAGSPGDSAKIREREMRRAVWSGEQRGGVETEVVYPSLGPERGRGERGRAYP